MIAVTSLESALRDAVCLFALGLLAAICAPVARAQVQVAFRHATTEGHLVVHAMALSPSGRPHALMLLLDEGRRDPVGREGRRDPQSTS